MMVAMAAVRQRELGRARAAADQRRTWHPCCLAENRMHWRSGAVLMLAFLAASAGSDDALRVRAVQHRGWWELRYPDGTVAANELHVPVGRPVVVEATLDGGGAVRFS